MTLKDKTILLGVTGGIGAYKAIELTRLLTKAGADVWPVMTDASMEFIGPLSLETLSGNPVSSSLFKTNETGRINHIELAEKADLVIIAPGYGQHHRQRSPMGLPTTYSLLSFSPPQRRYLIAPAMNNRMYENRAVQANIEKLKELWILFCRP